MKQVTIYSKDYCPYCHAAKALLKSKGVLFKEIDMMTISDADREELSSKTDGYSTVPQIFVGDEFVGGFDDLKTLDSSGKLDLMLKE